MTHPVQNSNNNNNRTQPVANTGNDSLDQLAKKVADCSLIQANLNKRAEDTRNSPFFRSLIAHPLFDRHLMRLLETHTWEAMMLAGYSAAPSSALPAIGGRTAFLREKLLTLIEDRDQTNLCQTAHLLSISHDKSILSALGHLNDEQLKSLVRLLEEPTHLKAFARICGLISPEIIEKIKPALSIPNMLYLLPLTHFQLDKFNATALGNALKFAPETKCPPEMTAHLIESAAFHKISNEDLSKALYDAFLFERTELAQQLLASSRIDDFSIDSIDSAFYFSLSKPELFDTILTCPRFNEITKERLIEGIVTAVQKGNEKAAIALLKLTQQFNDFMISRFDVALGLTVNYGFSEIFKAFTEDPRFTIDQYNLANEALNYSCRESREKIAPILNNLKMRFGNNH